MPPERRRRNSNRISSSGPSRGTSTSASSPRITSRSGPQPTYGLESEDRRRLTRRLWRRGGYVYEPRRHDEDAALVADLAGPQPSRFSAAVGGRRGHVRRAFASGSIAARLRRSLSDPPNGQGP